MKMILNGKPADARDGSALDVINPATGAVVDTVPAATREDVEEAVDAAREGFPLWRSVPLYERIEILYRFADLVAGRREAYAKILCDSTGKTYRSCLGEADGCAQLTRFFCEKARNVGGETLALDSEPSIRGDVVFTVREPLGVVVCVVPFNYPANLYTNKVVPALLMGNAVIAKPTSDAPLDTLFLSQLLLEAGVHPKALQCITGGGSTVGAWLAGSPKIDAVSLTGSVRTGVEIAKAAAPNLTKVMLELGGNDGVIVMDDADLDAAAGEAVFGRLHNGGQTCAAPKRWLVHNKVRAGFVEKLKAAFAEIKVGDPYDEAYYTGPLISEQAAIEVEEQVRMTVGQGATLVCGGGRDGAFFEPTILDDVTPQMDIARDLEVFGPVVPVIGFDTLDEALAISNASVYGLNGGIFTKDMKTAFLAAFRMDAGTVVVGGSSFYRFDHLPFGGHKKSGIGNEGVSITLEEMSQLKSIAFKKQLEE
ncbi:MAG: aldehyde dehydrogenase family protein [Clostridiales Family XIII bacterium]|jgi:succinate-semialdehyde dehydrogenase/glutarate-semialdehyde dehydrogenase|nr:aldehyde dehydrogenase family protein [Clostridiales Family XIII bacterium]